MRSDSLRRTAAAATELLNANHEMKARAAPQRTRGMVNTSHGRVKETPLDCKRTLPPAHSCGVSARPPPPRRARQGRTRRRCETCPRRERLVRRVWTCKITVRAGHARRSQSSHPIFFATDRPKAAPGVHLAPALLPNPGRGRLTRHSCATPQNAAPNDPDLVTQHQTMNKFGAQALGRSFLSLLFAGDDDRRLGRATTIDLEAVLAVSRRTWPQHLAAYH